MLVLVSETAVAVRGVGVEATVVLPTTPASPPAQASRGSPDLSGQPTTRITINTTKTKDRLGVRSDYIRAEYDLDHHRLAFILKDGRKLDLGLEIQPPLRPYIERAEVITMIGPSLRFTITGSYELPVRRRGEQPFTYSSPDPSIDFYVAQKGNRLLVAE